MTEPETEPVIEPIVERNEDERLATFANYVISDWEAAMDHFFERVERAAERKELTDEQVGRALERGYGDEVAVAWMEWTAEA